MKSQSRNLPSSRTASAKCELTELGARILHSHLLNIGMDHATHGSSQYFQLTADLVSASVKYCSQNDRDESELTNMAHKLLQLATDLRAGLNKSNQEDGHLWDHQTNPVQQVLDKETPWLDRDQIEDVATRYLRQPVRSDLIDSLLVDAITALELYAYLNHIHNPDPIRAITEEKNALHRDHPFKMLFMGRLKDLAVFSVIIALAWVFNDPLGAFVTITITVLAVSYFVGYTIYVLLHLPGACRIHNDELNAMTTLSQALSQTYASVAIDREFSVMQTMQLAEAAASVGVVWPVSLFPFLEDVQRRRSN